MDVSRDMPIYDGSSSCTGWHSAMQDLWQYAMDRERHGMPWTHQELYFLWKLTLLE